MLKINRFLKWPLEGVGLPWEGVGWARGLWDGFIKVSDGLRKVLDCLGKPLDGLGKVSDCLKNVLDGSGESIGLGKVSDGLKNFWMASGMRRITSGRCLGKVLDGLGKMLDGLGKVWIAS